MVWRCQGAKPLSEPMMVCPPTPICVTRPQWVNAIPPNKTTVNITLITFLGEIHISYTQCMMRGFPSNPQIGMLLEMFLLRSISPQTHDQHGSCSYTGACISLQPPIYHGTVFLGIKPRSQPTVHLSAAGLRRIRWPKRIEPCHRRTSPVRVLRDAGARREHAVVIEQCAITAARAASPVGTWQARACSARRCTSDVRCRWGLGGRQMQIQCQPGPRQPCLQRACPVPPTYAWQQRTQPPHTCTAANVRVTHLAGTFEKHPLSRILDEKKPPLFQPKSLILRPNKTPLF